MDPTFSTLLVIGLLVMGLEKMKRDAKAAYQKLDNDGTIHSAAKSGIAEWIKKKLK